MLSEFITFNDHLEPRKDLVGRMRKILRDDSDIGIILKYFFKSKLRPAKQGWTDEFTTKKFEYYLYIIIKPRSLAVELENVTIHLLYGA